MGANNTTNVSRRKVLETAAGAAIVGAVSSGSAGAATAGTDQHIALIGTESYHNHRSRSHANDIMYTVSDWWEEMIADDGEYEATFSFLLTEIPEDALESDFLSYRREQAADWLDDNLSSFDSRSSYCVLDWHEDGYAHGQAGPAAAMTDSKDKTTITNVYKHVGDDFYSEVGPAATVFHELLHDYSASHSDAGIDTTDTASIMYSSSYDDDHGEDDFCFWVGDKADKQSDWITFCTEYSVQSYINDHA